MKYDDASWHYGGDFPDDLPDEAGATHIAMFLAWALLADLGGDYHASKCSDQLKQLRARRVTPGAYFIENCDEKLTDLDLNEVGNVFAAYYYGQEDTPYYADFEDVLGKTLPTLYHVADTWENFDKLKPIIDQRFLQWRQEALQ